MIGGQDELVFDGDSIVVDAGRRSDRPRPAVRARAASCSTWSCPPRGADAARGRGRRRAAHRARGPLRGPAARVRAGADRRLRGPRLDDDEEIYTALVVGLRAYAAKNGFRSVLIGLSGGIDSALVAADRLRRAGRARTCTASRCPPSYSSDHSKGDAAELARRTGLNFRTVPIEPMFDAYMGSLGLTGLAEENLQSRLRGTMLMAPLQPGGPHRAGAGQQVRAGGAAIRRSTATPSARTARSRTSTRRTSSGSRSGATAPPPSAARPRRSRRTRITKPPSAELRPGQVDTDSLPDYDVLDAILELYVDRRPGPRRDRRGAASTRELVARVLRMVDTAEYKRRQYPPGTKISAKGFGKDRRLPITNRWREQA